MELIWFKYYSGCRQFKRIAATSLQHILIKHEVSGPFVFFSALKFLIYICCEQARRRVIISWNLSKQGSSAGALGTVIPLIRLISEQTLDYLWTGCEVPHIFFSGKGGRSYRFQFDLWCLCEKWEWHWQCPSYLRRRQCNTCSLIVQ